MRNNINPKIDLVFKKLFGTANNIELLKSLANSILPKEEQVVKLELKNPYNPSDYLSGKITYLDIKATDEKGRWYDIEIQLAPYDFVGMRVLYYWTKKFDAQLKSGRAYNDLRKTIVISLINFNYFKDPKGKKRFHRRIGLCDLDTKNLYKQTDGLELIFVELKKFKKELPEIHTTLERWITFLNKASEYTDNKLPPELSDDHEIKKAMKELEKMYFNEKEQQHFEAQEKKFLDDLAYKKQEERKLKAQKIEIKKAVKKAVQIAEEKAEEKGIEKGVEKGIEKGVEKGKDARNFEIAKQMKAENENIDKIIKFTGLSKNQIEKL